MFVLLRKAAVWSVLLMSLMSRRALLSAEIYRGHCSRVALSVLVFLGSPCSHFLPLLFWGFLASRHWYLAFISFWSFLEVQRRLPENERRESHFLLQSRSEICDSLCFREVLGAIKGIWLYNSPVSIWSAFKCNHICTCWALFCVSISFFFKSVTFPLGS